MAAPRIELLNRIAWRDEIPAGAWEVLSDLGCLAFRVQGTIEEDSASCQLLVFRAADPGDTRNLTVVTDWDELPPTKRNFIDNAKGTGCMTGNTPRSVAVFAEGKDGNRNGIVAAYLSPLVVPQRDVLDVRDPDNWLGKKLTLARSTARYVGSKVLGERWAVECINYTYLNPQYEPYDVVEMSPAPLRMAEETKRRGPFEHTPYWLLWRNHTQTLSYVGSVPQAELW